MFGRSWTEVGLKFSTGRGQPGDHVALTEAVARYVESLEANRRMNTQRRDVRVLQTFAPAS